MAFRFIRPSSYSLGTLDGHFSAQSPQPTHLSTLTYLGFFFKVTVKLPASPSTFMTSVKVIMLIIGCLAASTSFGDRIHIEQSLVGKVLSNWAMTPPMLALLSTM
ncbi:MAG: hypothetical protein A4E29_00830 [Methanomassiliicoccales archaeon PtaB.Bin134]|nr:MAG: hypothetical protein A4E29_00830 [Methanomassiliicoccales archaeon PtaB.Bin134]